MKCETVKVACDNEQGFYICNKDSVPKHARLFKEKKSKDDSASEKESVTEE